MRAIWKGTIGFGLVNIPVSLYPAIRREELKFRLLRASDLSPVNYRRVAEADGKEVPWEEIVKGYEYEKGKFVVLREEDFKRVDVEATQTVEIVNFIELEAVNPLLFYKPYYMEVGRGGDKAYVLLRDSLVKTGKIALAKVVIKTRQHLAAVKAQEKGLMLELMYYPDELMDLSKFKAAVAKSIARQELQMATQLIGSLTTEWEPEKYSDEYRVELEKLIHDKIEHGDKALPAPRRKAPASNVIDLASVLRQSLQETQERTKSSPTKTRAGSKKTRSAARSRKKVA